jgi:hypothetical protein
MLQIAVIDAQPSPVPLTVPGNNLRTVELVQFRPRELVQNGPAALLDATNSAWLLLNPAALRAHGFGCASGLSLQDAGRRAHYRRAALAATAAVAALSTGFVAFTEFATHEKSRYATTAELVAAHVNAAAEKSEHDAPKIDLEPAQLRAVVQARDRLLARNIDALGLLQHAAAALAPFPDLNVDTLEWSYIDAPSPAAAGGAGTPPPDGSAAPPANTIVLRVGGHVGGSQLKSDANSAVVGLAAALAQQLHGRQSIEKLPFDVAPGGTLAARPTDVESAKTEFKVTVAVPADNGQAS